MFKSLICFLGLCSFMHATNIDFIEVPQGRERLVEPTCVVICDSICIKQEIIDSLRDPNTTRKKTTPHIFIGPDGGITCFVPSDSQLEIAEKFPSKAEYARRERDSLKEINDSDYARLANYLVHGCYEAGVAHDMEYGWGGKTGCANFSINITLATIPFDGILGINPYTDVQIDTVYNVLQALTNEGIDKKNILALPDLDLFSMQIPLKAFFWKRFYERHDGFFDVPQLNTTHNINSADELENALLRIGYTNPIVDPETHAKFTGDDCWLRRAVNAFVLHYIPEKELKIDLLDETAAPRESDIYEKMYRVQRKLWPMLGLGYDKEQTYNMLKNEHPEILSAIEQIANL